MAFSQEKAKPFYSGEKKITDTSKIPEIEKFYFNELGFEYDNTTAYVCGTEYRRFILNKEKTKYYCSPAYGSIGAFRIRDCNKIKNAELIVEEAGSGAVTGAILFGAAGAIAGSTMKKSIIRIALQTTDINEPIVNLPILPEPMAKNNKYFIKCFNDANKILGQLKAIADKNSPSSPQSSPSSSVADELAKLKALQDQGILTQEEFDAQKKRVLGIQ